MGRAKQTVLVNCLACERIEQGPEQIVGDLTDLQVNHIKSYLKHQTKCCNSGDYQICPVHLQCEAQDSTNKAKEKDENEEYKLDKSATAAPLLALLVNSIRGPLQMHCYRNGDVQIKN